MNQTMKFGQLRENKVRNNFLQKPCRKRDKETSFKPRIFKKALHDVKAIGQ